MLQTSFSLLIMMLTIPVLVLLLLLLVLVYYTMMLREVWGTFCAGKLAWHCFSREGADIHRVRHARPVDRRECGKLERGCCWSRRSSFGSRSAPAGSVAFKEGIAMGTP